MNAEKFEKLCKELLDKSQDTLFKKSKEYASDEDRLANFRQPTSMTGYSTAEVCLMYQMKHLASITKIAKESSQGIYPSKELLQEKCQDVLNYTLIFYAAMMELIEKNTLNSSLDDSASYPDISKLVNPVLSRELGEFDLRKYWDPTLLRDFGKPQCSSDQTRPPEVWYKGSCSGCTNSEDEKQCLHGHNNSHFE